MPKKYLLWLAETDGMRKTASLIKEAIKERKHRCILCGRTMQGDFCMHCGAHYDLLRGEEGDKELFYKIMRVGGLRIAMKADVDIQDNVEIIDMYRCRFCNKVTDDKTKICCGQQVEFLGRVTPIAYEWFRLSSEGWTDEDITKHFIYSGATIQERTERGKGDGLR